MAPSTPSLLNRLRWACRLYLLKALLRVFVFARRIGRSPNQRPTYIKKYPSTGLNLENSVWIPSSYKTGDPPLPLFIDIHGGGFCIGHPTLDDRDNAILCHKHGICIVSINYRKAPAHPFPVPAHDCAAMIAAVLDDPDLPVDKARVAVGGYSAGGNLSLTAPQLNGLAKRLKGVVAIYPAADPGRSLQKRLETSTPPPNRPDLLLKMAPAFDWAYRPPDHDRNDPLLAPLHADRRVLPEKVYIIGCEYDILCAEARETAEHLAEGEGNTAKELGEGRSGWQCGTVTWEEIKGVEHGFNQRWAYERLDAAEKKVWEEKTDDMLAHVAEWLFKEVYE